MELMDNLKASRNEINLQETMPVKRLGQLAQRLLK
jgi:hypothetical protein